MATMYGITNGNSKRPQSVTASAGVGTYTGDWFIEDQQLTIRYVRIPTMVTYTDPNETLQSASAVNVRHNSVTETRLICMFFPRYTCRKEVNTTYTTSSDLQLQKFSVAAANTDKFGTSYGTVSGTILGPAGIIYTSQPYTRRVPWDDTVHSEISQFTPCTNVVITSLSPRGQMAGVIDANTHVGLANARYDQAIDPVGANNFCGAKDVKYYFGPTILSYPILGDYSTSKESTTKLQVFLDAVADSISAYQMYTPRPIVNGSQNDFLYGQLLHPIEIQDSIYVGVPQYHKKRHDYS